MHTPSEEHYDLYRRCRHYTPYTCNHVYKYGHSADPKVKSGYCVMTEQRSSFDVRYEKEMDAMYSRIRNHSPVYGKFQKK